MNCIEGRGRGEEWGQKNTRTKFKVGTDSHKQPQRDTYRNMKMKTTSKMKTAKNNDIKNNDGLKEKVT